MKLNAVSSAGVMGLAILVAFVLTPLMLRELGERRYGMWTLASSLVGYFSLLQFGLTTSVFRYVPHFRGRGEHDRVSAVVSSSLFFYSFVGIVVFLLLLGGANYISAFFNGGRELAGLIRVLGFAFCLELPSLILNTTLTGYEEFTKTNVIAGWTLLLRGGLLLGCVWLGYGLVAMGWVLVIVRIATLAGQLFLFKRVCTDVQVSLKAAHWKELRMLLMFGGVIVVASTGNALAVEAPKQIVGKLISLETLAIFGVVMMLMSYFRQLIFTLTKVLTPRFGFLSGSGENAEIASLFLKSSRYVAMLATGVALLAWVAGPRFLVLWTRREQMEQGIPALLVLIAGNFVLLSNRVTSDLLLGLGRQGLLATFELLEAVVIVGLTLWLSIQYGITGAALGMSLPFIIVRGVFQPAAVCRVVGVKLSYYYGKCVAGPWIVGFSLAVASGLLGVSQFARGWASLTFLSVAALVAYVAPVFVFVTTPSEKAYLKGRLAGVLAAWRPASRVATVSRPPA
ncbi:MAG: oligosaccharide flippase family protein [Verrucomicrobiota bacterium]